MILMIANNYGIANMRKGSFIPKDIVDIREDDENIVFSGVKYGRFSDSYIFGQFPKVSEDNHTCYKITKNHMKKAISLMEKKLEIMKRLYENELNYGRNTKI